MFANKSELKPQNSNTEMPNTKCIYTNRRISYGFIVIIFLLFNNFDDVTEAAVLPSSLEYEEFDKIPAEMYDLDTKQSQARYDSRTLLKEFFSRMKQTNGNSYTYGGSAKIDTSTTIDDGDLYAEERNSGGAHCMDGNERYEHGEKIQRTHPCEMCLCIDGEIFCWWQKCSGKRQKHTQKRPHPDLRHKWNHLGDESYHEHNRIHSKTSDNNQSQNKYKEHSISTAGAIATEEESAAYAYQTKDTTSNVLLLQQKHEQQPDKLQHHEQIKNKFPKKSSSSASASASAFGKHHSLHIMDMNVSEMDSDDKDVKIHGSTSFYRKIYNNDKSIDEPTTGVKSQILTSTVMDAHQQSKNSQHNDLVDRVKAVAIPGDIAPLSSQALPLPNNIPIVHADVTNGLLENGVVLNDRVTSIAAVDRNGNDGMLARRPFNGHKNNTINIINKNNNNNDSTVNPVILAGDDKQFGLQTSHFSDADSIVDTPNIQEYVDDTNGMDKAFYEKTIVNKNGVFIENIRKISGLDQRLFDAIDNADDDTIHQINQKNNFDKIVKMDDTMNAAKSILASDASSIDDEHNDNKRDEINRKSIDLLNNEAVVQHYVITSSGKIEKTDSLNSDEVQMQMQGVNNNNNNNNINGPYELAKTEDEMLTITATISTPKSTLTTANNFAAKTQQTDYLLGGSLLTTINSAVPMSVTTSSLADQSNSNCIVMGKSYKIGTILPQEPGNCLQCLCVKGANEGDAPRVTCSPHNCPPLILPDLFDSTGY